MFCKTKKESGVARFRHFRLKSPSYYSLKYMFAEYISTRRIERGLDL